MKTSLGQMDGNAWQSYCQKLLHMRYEDYQEVPSRFGGDLGVEGFTCSGLTFQCYCPDEDPSGKGLYELQRDKVTRDIGKLIRNASKITELGAGIIKEWHFLTPIYNSKDLLSHCRLKEYDVRKKALSTIHSEFRIYIKIEDDYIPERQMFIKTGGFKVQPSGEEPAPEELEKWFVSGNKIVLNIKAKLDKLESPSAKRAGLVRELVTGYIVGQNEIETLNQKFPSIYRSVVQLKSATESQLAIRTLCNTNNQGTVLQEVLKEYEEKLSSDFSESLSGALITRLSTEAISDWLGRCPLDFYSKGTIDEKR